MSRTHFYLRRSLERHTYFHLRKLLGELFIFIFEDAWKVKFILSFNTCEPPFQKPWDSVSPLAVAVQLVYGITFDPILV